MTFLDDDLAPLAAELIGCVHDYAREDWDNVFARIPVDRQAGFAYLLAAMVDPAVPVSKHLAWTRRGPAESRDKFMSSRVWCPECGKEMSKDWLNRHRSEQHAVGKSAEQLRQAKVAAGSQSGYPALERREKIRELTAAGLSAMQIAEQLGIEVRTVSRHRAAIRRNEGTA